MLSSCIGTWTILDFLKQYGSEAAKLVKDITVYKKLDDAYIVLKPISEARVEAYFWMSSNRTRAELLIWLFIRGKNSQWIS